jgi:hypothetical protein
LVISFLLLSLLFWEVFNRGKALPGLEGADCTLTFSDVEDVGGASP